MNNKLIGRNIKKYRKELGLTQERLAELLDVSTVHLSHIEGGSVSMSLDLLLRICEALSVTPNHILSGAYSDSGASPSGGRPSDDLLQHVSPELRLLCHEIIDLIQKSPLNRS